MSDAVETYAGIWQPWWAGSSATAKQMTVTDQPLTPVELLHEAGMLWTVSKRRLAAENLDGQLNVNVPGWEAICRDSDDAFMGMVSPTYHTLQNRQMAEWAEALTQQVDQAVAVSAGSLFGGKRVWIQLKLGDQILIKGDPSPMDLMLLVSTGHDGRHALGSFLGITRVVCANTLNAGIGGASASYYCKHTTNMERRIEDAQEALKISFKYAEEYKAVAAKLMTVRMTMKDMLAFTEKLLPVNPEVEHAYRTEAERAAIVDLFTNSHTLDGVKLNGYRAFQAVAEYTDHVAAYRSTKIGSAEDRQALAIIEGTAVDLKSAAIKLLVPAAAQ